MLPPGTELCIRWRSIANGRRRLGNQRYKWNSKKSLFCVFRDLDGQVPLDQDNWLDPTKGRGVQEIREFNVTDSGGVGIESWNYPIRVTGERKTEGGKTQSTSR